MPRINLSKNIDNMGYEMLRIVMAALISYAVLKISNLTLDADPIKYVLVLIAAFLVSLFFMKLVFGAHDRARRTSEVKSET